MYSRTSIFIYNAYDLIKFVKNIMRIIMNFLVHLHNCRRQDCVLMYIHT